MGSSARPAKDEWLLATLEGLLSPEQLTQLKERPVESLWDEVAPPELRDRGRDHRGASPRASGCGSPTSARVTQQARELVPEALARKYRILPLAISDSVLDIATADPHRPRLRAHARLRARPHDPHAARLAARRSSSASTRCTAPRTSSRRSSRTCRATTTSRTISETVDDADLDIGARRARSERPVIQLVDHIVAEGIQSRASDIHIEPEESGVAVRYRIDGVLRQVMMLPRAAGIPLVSRIKIMAQLDIADRLRPQDGRARVAVSGNRVDLRVSTLPASQGEKVVIRILDQRATILVARHRSGCTPDEHRAHPGAAQAREGIVLVTGPTGSGKTTTLYSMLRADPGDAA